MTTFSEVLFYDARDRDVPELQFPVNRFETEVLLPLVRHFIEESAEAIDKLPEFVVEQTLRPIRDLHDRLEECRDQFVKEATERAPREAEVRAEVARADAEPEAVAVAATAVDDDIPF